MLKKLIGALVCLVLICLLIVLYPKRQKDKAELVVGMMSGWAPFMSVNPQGYFEGFDVDVAQLIAQRMGKKLVIKDLGSLASCFIALDQKRVDMLFSGLDITQKRLESVAMVPYVGQGTREYFLVFYKQIPEGVTQLDDLKKLKNPIVCVEPGHSTEKFLDQYPFITKKQLSSLPDMLLDLEYGKSTAAFLEPQLVRRLQEKGIFAYLPVPLPPEFIIYGCGIALKKGRPELEKKVALVIEELKREGSIKQLEEKWQLTGV